MARRCGARRIETPDERIAWFVVVATIPAAIVGALGEDAIAEHLGEPWQIAILLARLRGAPLWLADRQPQRGRWATSASEPRVGMGFAQCAGADAGRLALGDHDHRRAAAPLDRDSAARFSFLLLVPTVLGAVVYKGVKDVLLGDLPAGWEGPFVVGTLAAAGSGLIAISALLGYVRRHDYSFFVLYRLIVAAIVLLLIATGVRGAGF